MLASAVPVKVGVLSLVTAPSAGAVIVGADGAEVSTVISVIPEVALMLPAASVAVAAISWSPSAKPVPGVKVQTPLPFAVTVPSRVTPL